MSNIPEDLRYTKDHEWVRMEGDICVVGITDHAQEELGDLVFVDMPEVGLDVEPPPEDDREGNGCAVVESVKAASDVYAPIAGKITEINQELVDAPDALNADPYGKWLFKIQPTNASDVEKLLSAAEYKTEIDE